MKRYLGLLVLLTLIIAISGCGETTVQPGSGPGAIAGTLSSFSAEPTTAKTLATTTSPSALQGVKVQVEGNDSVFAITDSSGNFLIKNVPTGTYSLIANTVDGNGNPLLLRKEDVQVLPGTTIALSYDLGGEPAGAVYGNITIPGRDDLSGILIYVPADPLHATYTERDGSFLLTSLAAGKYLLRARVPGYSEYEFHDIKVNSGLATPLPSAMLTRITHSFNVTGSVQLSGPPPSVKVQAQLFPVQVKPGDYNVYLVDVVDGKFAFESVVPGGYTLTVGDHVNISSSGIPGTSYGEVAPYQGNVLVGSSNITIPAITLYPGSIVTSISKDLGFSFDTGTFNGSQASDIFLKEFDYLSTPMGISSPFTVYSNGNNLAMLPYTDHAGFADLRLIPATSFVSSLTVDLLDVIVVRTSAGNYAKVLFNGYGYYGQKSHVTFQWQLQPDGAQQFDY